MFSLKRISIQRKMTLVTLVTCSVVLLVATGALCTFQLFAFRQNFQRDLAVTAEIIADNSIAPLTFKDQKSAAEVLSALKAKPRILYAWIQLPDGSIFAQFGIASRSPGVTAMPANGFRFEGGCLLQGKPILLGSEQIGTLYLKSDYQTVRNELLRFYAGILAAVLPVSFLLAFALSARLQRFISEPILRLSRTAKVIMDRKDYSVRADKMQEDELGLFTDTFNQMLEQIQKQDADLQQARSNLEGKVAALQCEITERQRAEAALQQQFSRISLFNQITYAIVARQDFESIVSVVLQQLEKHLPVDYSAAYFLDEPTGMLKVMVRGPKSQPLAEQLQIPSAIPIAQTPFRPCLQGEMVYVPDGNRLDLAVSQKLAGAGFASCVAVPLVTKDKVFGLLVLSRRQPNGYSDAEQDFIRGLSAHVALAVHQAQLYQDLRTAYVELHQTQQTVMQQERLKALGQMASGIAHDINNALSPVVGFAELINQTESALSEDSKKYLEYIKTAGQDVAQIVARLREFYRPRDPEESLQLLDLNHVAAQALDMTRPRWRDIPQGRGIMIEARTDFDPHLAKFCGIESESREAITNLIINAVDALPHGGTLEIRTRMQKSDAEEVILEVRDTGIGMDEQTRKRCLEPFFSTKGQRGTGLGLATVYGVMERHKGRIEIESEPGKGTVMRLIFPVRRLVKTDPVNPAENVPPGPFWILCIDDEPGVRKLLHKMLELDHHQVQMTDGGEAGLEAFRAANGQGRPFDVVITDLGMPYLDGREVAKILKRESPGTPIIMLTGWGVFMKDDGRTLSQVDGILSKPPSLQELREMLRRVVHREIREQP